MLVEDGSSTANHATSQGGAVASMVATTQPGETESPASDLSGRNGSRGRVLK